GRGRRSTSTPGGSGPTGPGRPGASPMATADRFRTLPKIELHLHAAGSVRPATMREFVSADGLSPALSEAYRPAALGEGLTAYLARFAAWDGTVQSPDRMARVVAELGADLASDGIIHAEVRLRPPADDDRLWHAMMEAAIAAARRLVTPRLGFITVLLRGWTKERAEREARRTVAWAARGVVALDVAGDEGLGGIRPLEGAIR